MQKTIVLFSLAVEPGFPLVVVLCFLFFVKAACLAPFLRHKLLTKNQQSLQQAIAAILTAAYVLY
jgi:hypothetical protein